MNNRIIVVCYGGTPGNKSPDQKLSANFVKRIVIPKLKFVAFKFFRVQEGGVCRKPGICWFSFAGLAYGSVLVSGF